MPALFNLPILALFNPQKLLSKGPATWVNGGCQIVFNSLGNVIDYFLATFAGKLAEKMVSLNPKGYILR